MRDQFSARLRGSSAHRIFTKETLGIPPSISCHTQAGLINSTSLITLNNNYLLATCLSDSLLTKININDGSFSSLLGYSDIDSSLNLPIPITACSLSFIDNTIFIGYSEINYYPEEINKTNIIIKIDIINKDSDDGPDINTNTQIKYFIFTNSTKN